MSWPEVESMFAGLDGSLQTNATLVIYGPFNYGGALTSASNADFDQWLKARGTHMGIRDLEAVDALARGIGLPGTDDTAMAATNCLMEHGRAPSWERSWQ